MRESALLRQCLEYLAMLSGVFVWRCNSGAVVGEYKGRRRFVRFTSAKGLSDIIGIARGRFLAVETKSKAGKLTPNQQAFLLRIAGNGGIALVVRSLDELIDGLKREGVDQ